MCQGYAGQLQQLAATYQPRGVAFVGVFPNFYATDSAMLAFQNQYALPFAVEKDPDFQLTNRFGATITPEAVVVDAAGQVVYRGMIDNAYFKPGKRRGTTTAYYLQDALEQLLAGEPVRKAQTQAIGCVIVRD